MTARPRYPRSSCCVPFCARWSTLFPPGEEWMCGRHWRLADRSLRRFFRVRLRQLYDRWAAAPQNSRQQFLAWRRWHRTNRLIWARIKRQVIGRAGELPA